MEQRHTFLRETSNEINSATNYPFPPLLAGQKRGIGLGKRIVFFFPGKVCALLTSSFSEDCVFFPQKWPEKKKQLGFFFPVKVENVLTNLSPRLSFFFRVQEKTAFLLTNAIFSKFVKS